MRAFLFFEKGEKMDSIELYDGYRWIKRKVSDCDESVRGMPARCPECKQPAIFCSGPVLGPYYRSDMHLPTCGVAKGGRTFFIQDGYEIRLKDILSAVDGPYLPPEQRPVSPGKDTLPARHTEDEPSLDNYTITGPLIAKTCKTVYEAVKEMSPYDHITPDITVREFLVDDSTIEYHRTHGLSNVHMMMAKIFHIRGLEPPLPSDPKYIYLRDPYTWNSSDAIYYKLRCNEPSQDKHFRDLLFSEKSVGKIVIFIGKVIKVPNDTYKIYEVTPLARARYCFVNLRDYD